MTMMVIVIVMVIVVVDHDDVGDDNRAHDQGEHRKHRGTTSRTWDSSRKKTIWLNINQRKTFQNEVF